jgi:hypothetical protein
VAVTGCLPHQSKDLASCVAEAERFYHIYDAVDLENPGSKYVISCMAAKGYQFSILTSDCDIRRPMPTQATCYEPTSWQPWGIDRVFRALKITAHTSWRVERALLSWEAGGVSATLASFEAGQQLDQSRLLVRPNGLSKQPCSRSAVAALKRALRSAQSGACGSPKIKTASHRPAPLSHRLQPEP